MKLSANRLMGLTMYTDRLHGVVLCSDYIEIAWKYPSPITVSRRKIDLAESRLSLFDLRSSDAGQYGCVGTNDNGSTEFHFQLVISGMLPLMPSTHRRRRRDETVSSRRQCEHNSQLYSSRRLSTDSVDNLETDQTCT